MHCNHHFLDQNWILMCAIASWRIQKSAIYFVFYKPRFYTFSMYLFTHRSYQTILISLTCRKLAQPKCFRTLRSLDSPPGLVCPGGTRLIGGLDQE
jgi:hypothetical protein